MTAAPKAAKPMVLYTGPFRVAFKQIATVRDFQTGIATANAQFEVAWEPGSGRCSCAQGRRAQDRRRPGQGGRTPR